MNRAHIYPLQAVKLLFHYMNYPPDIQPCRNTKIMIKFPNTSIRKICNFTGNRDHINKK